MTAPGVPLTGLLHPLHSQEKAEPLTRPCC